MFCGIETRTLQGLCQSYQLLYGISRLVIIPVRELTAIPVGIEPSNIDIGTLRLTKCSHFLRVGRFAELWHLDLHVWTTVLLGTALHDRRWIGWDVSSSQQRVVASLWAEIAVLRFRITEAWLILDQVWWKLSLNAIVVVLEEICILEWFLKLALTHLTQLSDHRVQVTKVVRHLLILLTRLT